MTQQRRTALKELQKLDVSIHDARDRIVGFDPLFEEVEEPALILAAIAVPSDATSSSASLYGLSKRERSSSLLYGVYGVSALPAASWGPSPAAPFPAASPTIPINCLLIASAWCRAAVAARTRRRESRKHVESLLFNK